MTRDAEGSRSSITARWFVEVTVLLSLATAAFASAFTFYRSANAPAPVAQFYGALLITVSSITKAQPPNDLKLTISYGSNSRSVIEDLAKVDSVELSIKTSQRTSGFRVNVTSVGDARLDDVVILRPEYGTNSGGSKIPVEAGPSTPGGAENFSFIAPETGDKSWYEITLNAKMKKPVGGISGSVAEINLPISSGLGFEKVTTAMGQVYPGESVPYASPSLKDASVLSWESESGSPVNPRFRIADEVLQRYRENNVFIAGALLGLAGGAFIELMTRLTHLTDLGRRRPRFARDEWSQADERSADSSGQADQRQLHTARNEVGEVWRAWRETNRRRK